MIEKKKISELDGIVGLESDKVIAIHLTTLRAWAIAVVREMIEESVDTWREENKDNPEYATSAKDGFWHKLPDGRICYCDPESSCDFHRIGTFLIDRFEIKPEELR